MQCACAPTTPLPTATRSPPRHPPPDHVSVPQVVEVAEARLVDVTVDGSLIVVADSVMGHWEDAAANMDEGEVDRRLTFI